MNAPSIICTLYTFVWYGASAARLDPSVLYWASYVIASLMKSLTHGSKFILNKSCYGLIY